MGCVSSGRFNELDSAHAKLQRELADARVQINSLEGSLESASSRGNELEGTLSEKERALAELRERERQAEQRIAQFQELTEKFRSLVDAGKLTVSVVDGRMVVQMQTDVLFGSGSARLSKDGRAAIEEVSGLLSSLADRRYQIEGHTDNVPIHTAAFPSNWELAAARAISVVSLMSEKGMDPRRVSAVSYGETTPIASNETPESKARNRRIEIVVVPDLSLLPGYAELERLSRGTPANPGG
jgi:chemotaxis protein MotB